MPKRTINLTGTSGATYDIDEIAKDSRLNGETPLLVQVYKYHTGESPNPANPAIGQIWISHLVSTEDENET